MRRIALFATLLIAPAALHAQTAPSAAPASQPQSASDVLNDMLKPGTADKVKPLQPIQGNLTVDKTTVNPVAPGSAAAPVMREGSYVVDRMGRMSRSADGLNWEFTFDSDQSTMADPPVVLLPCLKLMLMQDQLKAASADLHFRITGMVTEYMGRNYLLMDKVVVVADK